MEEYYRQFDRCRQWEPPFCTVKCPFGLDVPDFMEKMARGSHNAAYKTYKNAVGFPGIVASLCPEYCAGVCVRKDIDASVQLVMLEKTCVDKTTRKDPVDYNLPEKKEKIAVIGAGIGGLGCALHLASKKYKVTVFEKAGRIGGKLADLLEKEGLINDIELQFKHEDYELCLDTEIQDLDQLGAYDAVYITSERTAGNLSGTSGSSCLSDTDDGRIFIEKALIDEPMYSLAYGLKAAKSIEVYLKTGKHEDPREMPPTKAVADPDKLYRIDPIKAGGDIFTDEEAKAETERCIRCQCNACMVYSDLCDFMDKWPLAMRDEIMTTVMSSESMIHKTPAIKLINMCTQCMLCEEVCPEDIQLGRMIHDARYLLHKQEKMPGAYHQFWTRDMEFANGKFASLVKNTPEGKCDYAFFPGCHLGAADPEYVMAPYRMLLSENENTGLFLKCCGQPADWAGNEEMHNDAVSELRKDWEALGKPKLIMACASCMRHFENYLPEIEMISLYEYMDDTDSLTAEIKQGHPMKDVGSFSVFDPCSSRSKPGMQNSVRKLIENMGINIKELPKKDKHGCCGFGGNIEVASPKMAEEIAADRINLSDDPYIVYCINCRDIFHEEGKEAYHILDIMFGIETPRKLPNLTERRRNRTTLKSRLLDEFWGEEMEEKPGGCNLELKIAPQIREKIESLKLIDDDICDVIEFGERTGRRTFEPGSNIYRSYREIGHITCWVEYKKEGSVYLITDVYTHRMKIKLEAVWNGRKTDIDL